MHALLFFANNGLCGISSIILPAVPGSRLHGREITDGALRVASQRSGRLLICSSARSQGNRRGSPQKNISPDTSEKVMKSKDLPASDNKTPRPSSQDEILALFRRIQASISKGGSPVAKRRSRKTSIKKKAESVLVPLRQYPLEKQIRAQNPGKNEGSPQSYNEREDRASSDVKALRLTSNFVKKSPVPPPPLRENTTKVVDEQKVSDIGTNAKHELQKLGELKLGELKELAKTKGVKGYSRMKKGELVELLKDVLKSSS